MTTGDRIKERRKESGVPVEDIAKALNVSVATVYRYENGEIEKVPGSMLEPLAEILRTTPAYLMGWDEPTEQQATTDHSLTSKEQQIGHAYGRAPEPIQNATERLLEPYISPMAEVLRSLPRIVESEVEDERREMQLYALPASAGSGIFLDGEDFDVVEVGDEVPYNASYGVRISGRSMEPDYPNGHIAWVKMSPSVEVGRVGVFVYEGDGYIKEKGIGELISLNPDYENVKLPRENDCREYGEVVAVTPNVYR